MYGRHVASRLRSLTSSPAASRPGLWGSPDDPDDRCEPDRPVWTPGVRGREHPDLDRVQALHVPGRTGRPAMAARPGHQRPDPVSGARPGRGDRGLFDAAAGRARARRRGTRTGQHRPGGRLAVQLSVNRGGAEVTVLRGKVTLALVRERTAPAHRPAPDALAGFEVADLAEASTVARADRLRLPDRLRLADGESVESVFGNDPRTFVWSWRAPYFYCHFSDRVQHSGFVRALEEVVDRFLADRGISVGRLLAERSWIPVVSRARVQLVEAAHMEETIHTVFTVVDILRGVMFDARMSCYVQRGAELVPVATAQILHGYAIAAGDGAGGLAELDGEVSRALTGGRP